MFDTPVIVQTPDHPDPAHSRPSTDIFGYALPATLELTSNIGNFLTAFNKRKSKSNDDADMHHPRRGTGESTNEEDLNV